MNKKIKCNRRLTLSWFKEWIVLNNLDSTIEQDKSRETIFYFKDITRQLEIRVRSADIVVAAIYRNSCFDMLRCIETYPAKSEDGYYCEECNKQPPLIYKSLKELIIQHSFNELIDWYRETITPENSLFLMRKGICGSTWARITTEENLTDDIGYLIKTIPLFINK